jgi:uncharacterized delta-60 repeat protein
VVRYNVDGSLDTSFGSGGMAQANFGTNNANCNAAALYPQAGTSNDGKIVLEGWYVAPQSNGTTLDEVALARFNTNGTLDTTFGSGGEVLTSFSVGTTLLGVTSCGVVVTSTGQIVVTADNTRNICLARYNPNGTLDSTFGQGGTVITPFTQQASEENLAQQPDGKLVVAAWTGPDFSHSRWLVMRYNANGSLDPSFGTGGIVTTSFLGGDSATDVAVYPNAGTANDSKIVVVGYTGAGGGYREVARYNPDGSLDPTFGTGGKSVTAFGLTWAVALASDGKVVVAGGDGTSGGSFTLARYNVDGTPDATFGNGGVVTTTIATAYLFRDVAIQPNGDIVAVGGVSGDSLVARYLPSEPQIGLFTASPSPASSGGSVTLTAAGVADGNPGGTVAQVAFYQDSNGDGVLGPGDAVLGYGAQTSPGVWTLTVTVNLPPGTYTLFAQATDSYAVLGDPFATTLTVQ